MNHFIAKLSISMLLLLAVCMPQLKAQSLDQAKKLYSEGQYSEAKPALERLVKQVPSNPSYNLWYGISCFKTGDFSTAQKHLEVAAKRNMAEAYFYLSKVYFDTYHFQEASDAFQSYASLLTKKKQTPEDPEGIAERSKNAQRMLDKVEDIQIIDSTVVDKDQFLSAYTLSQECGSLQTAQQFFKSSDTSTVYMNQKGDKIFYAHATSDNHYCLFNQSKLMDKWGDEKQLPMTVNTNQDDNYPFVMSDGVTIYFASKGYNTIGGYDLYVTRYNIGTDTYLTPEQLGMPYNSPYNDYMIVFDETKNLGWFVSDRFQPEGKVCVYLFIPNADDKRIESDDMDLKRAHAAPYAIKDTWQSGSDYSKLISLAHRAIPFGQKKVQHDFEFVINDNTVLYSLDEIKSTEAKNLYMKVLAEKKQISDLQNKLDKLRARYEAAGGKGNDQLKQEIMECESTISSLYNQPAELEKQARNAEIRSMNNNN